MSESTTNSPPLRNAVGPLSAQIARAYAKAIAETIAPLEIAPAQLEVLRLLWKRDGATQSELARRLDVEQATMANTVKRLVRDGLIVFEPHPRDGRALCIRLTQKASALEREAKAAAKRVNILAVAGLSRKEQKRFVELGARVVSALKEQAEAPARGGAGDTSS